MTVTEHLVAFTFRDFSHFLPTIQLCTILAKTKNTHTTIVLDETSIKRIHDSNLIPEELKDSVPGIQLYPFSSDNNEMPDFFDAMVAATPKAVEDISEKIPVTGFIFETFGAHAYEKTVQFNLPHYVFFSINALATTHRAAPSFYPEMFKAQPKLPERVTHEVCLTSVNDIEMLHWLNKRFKTGLISAPPIEHEVNNLPRPTKSRMHDDKYLIKAMKSAKAILINSFEAFDNEESFKHLMTHPEMKSEFKMVGPVGLYREIKARDNLDHPILTWLDGQKESSVLYVAHGSHLVIKDSEVPELEKALLELDIPFIWSLPEKQHHLLADKSLCISKDVESINQKAVITSWAPQDGILKHKNTAAFVSHVGWNSMLEAMNGGVPIVAWPLFAEQFINASMVSAKGMGILMEGTSRVSETYLKSDDIKSQILKVLPEDGTSPFKAKMQYYQNEIRNAVERNGTSFNSICSL
ncbi:hypothetical protein HK103_000300 [Boothiomyces macroporosus]|uniref:Glycosyltransferase n=1 Tax=Boothiomyces macroporosus TaxID=261099 RepID=A0AAD5UP56_9FUNG|nr:hypothetical protein HK103_000278 [Boothiomyces macroporosus]KAJ3260690.1 hypothetical protein HK103_000300 [Boothiomyces macroporosus]